MAKEVKLRLRVLLAEKEWEQKDLVERTNLTNRAVSDLYNDKTKSYTKATLNELVQAFDVTDMNELFKIVETKDDVEDR
ncbi:Helix-turn-helix transcriptional regulator [Sporosarcina sp. ANT_H38]|uniref:helix-turn-helix domain-containing protein n=1 Tax=Sporosarcina sp. ANT_H38 TaxID=2597358 RepID=UPI00165E2710|nr:helix-turn-helix transcriptional regulator [Sporosarcina sp. ANT_H38]